MKRYFTGECHYSVGVGKMDFGRDEQSVGGHAGAFEMDRRSYVPMGKALDVFILRGLYYN